METKSRAVVIPRILAVLESLDEHEHITTAELARRAGIQAFAVHSRAGYEELARYRGPMQKGVPTTWHGAKPLPRNPEMPKDTIPQSDVPTTPRAEDACEDTIDDRLRYAQSTVTDLQRENTRLRKIITSHNEEARIVAGAITPVVIHAPVVFSKSKAKDDIQLVLALADIHMGEVVSPLEVPGCKYNRDEAFYGANDIIRRVVRWTDLHRESYNVTGAQVVVMGDIISGSFHAELLKTNEAPDPVCTAWAGQLLQECVGTLAQSLSVNVTCIPGNHGRTSKEIQFKRTFAESYEYLAYVMLREGFRSNDNVTVNIPENPIPNISVVTRDASSDNEIVHNIQALHGHQIKSSGPSPYYGLARRANALVKERAMLGATPALTTLVAHFHNWSVLENGLITLCPSLIGSSEWSRQMGFTTMPGQLAFFVGPRGRFDDTVFERRYLQEV